MIQVRDAGALMLHATLQSCTIASAVLSHKKRELMRNGKLDPGSVRFAWLKSVIQVRGGTEGKGGGIEGADARQSAARSTAPRRTH
eukprot:COSAG01_NODE_39116_length_480_cov_92.417323_1_plen_85_part_10